MCWLLVTLCEPEPMNVSTGPRAGLKMNTVSVSRGIPGLARRLGVGRLVYQFYHQPVGFLKRCYRFGPLNLWLTYRGSRQMEQAAYRLPPVEPAPPEAPAVHYLTGRRFAVSDLFLRLVVDAGFAHASAAGNLRRWLARR